MSFELYALVMAGGRGTRFWPESTSHCPKQYLKLFSDSSLLTETLNRFDGSVVRDKRYVVTVKEQEILARENTSGLIRDDGLIFEPSGRNTAPCVILSIATLMNKGASLDDVVVIVPSDHVILNKTGFREVLSQSAEIASTRQAIVTIGIIPNHPHTGYGYIKRGTGESNDLFKVLEFKEKPDSQTAKKYLVEGVYLWNSGMFISSIRTLLKEFETHAPEIYKWYGPLRENIGNFENVKEIYDQIPNNSIDYAVMEKSEKTMVIPARFDWNDLGSWDALEAVSKSTGGNTIVGESDHYFQNAKGNIVSAAGKFISLIGVDDLVIVSNDNALLVMPKKQSQKVKEVVKYLQDNHPEKGLL